MTTPFTLMSFEASLSSMSTTESAPFSQLGQKFENVGASVVDIDDNDASNDINVNGVVMNTHDFLKLGGVVATFQVWTGPRYKLDGTSGASTLNNPAPCKPKFSGKVSTDPAFPEACTIVSP